jgi:hypothetical protein
MEDQNDGENTRTSTGNMENKTKICRCCGESKDIDDFKLIRVHRQNKKGPPFIYECRVGVCNKCQSSKNRKYQREKYNAGARTVFQRSQGDYDFVFSDNINRWH